MIVGPFDIDGFDYSRASPTGAFSKNVPAVPAQTTAPNMGQINALKRIKENNLAIQTDRLARIQARVDKLTQEVDDLGTLVSPPGV